MFGQPNQQQTSGGLFGSTSQLGQSAGGFTFGAATGSNSTSSTPSVGGFNFSAPTPQTAGNINWDDHEQRSVKHACPIAVNFNEWSCWYGKLETSTEGLLAKLHPSNLVKYNLLPSILMLSFTSCVKLNFKFPFKHCDFWLLCLPDKMVPKTI